jgi:hypothetical protein
MTEYDRRQPASSKSEGPTAGEKFAGREERRSSAPMVDDISGTRIALG